MPAQCAVLIFTPYFHGDERYLANAHKFAPDHRLRKRPDNHSALVPFSDGPAFYPGQQLVLLLTSALLADRIKDNQFNLKTPHLVPDKPLPGTLNNYSLRFTLKSVP